MEQTISEKKKRALDFRFYDLPQEEPYLLFYGPGWRREYGYDEDGKLIEGQHFHNCLEIGICLKGNGILQYNSVQIPYKENTVSIVPKNMPHTTLNEAGRYSDWIWLFIDETSFLSDIFPHDKKLTQLIRRINCRTLCLRDQKSKFFRDIVQMIIKERERHEPYYRERIHAMIIEILFMIGRENWNYVTGKKIEGRDESWKFSEALSYIEQHYREMISIADIASSAGLSESYFRAVFRANMNISPLEYLNMIRIQKACEIMLHSSDTIENVAFKCGFSTISTFNRNFQKYLHASPMEWRKVHQENGNYSAGMKIRVHKGWH